MTATTPALIEALCLASRALDSAGLQHVFIGGIAVSAWSHPRTTLDLDVLVLSPGATAQPVYRALQTEHFEMDRAGIQTEAMLAGFRAVYRTPSGESTVCLDVLVSDNPVAVEIVGRAKHRTLAGATFAVPTVEDLIVLKLQAGRLQDIADAKALVDAQASCLDRSLLQSQARIFDLEQELAKLFGN